MLFGLTSLKWTLTTEYGNLAGTWGAAELSGRRAKIVLPGHPGESEEVNAKDGSGKSLYRNRGEGASGDEADSVTMILPGRGYELVRVQCEPLYLTATCGINNNYEIVTGIDNNPVLKLCGRNENHSAISFCIGIQSIDGYLKDRKKREVLYLHKETGKNEC